MVDFADCFMAIKRKNPKVSKIDPKNNFNVNLSYLYNHHMLFNHLFSLVDNRLATIMPELYDKDTFNMCYYRAFK